MGTNQKKRRRLIKQLALLILIVTLITMSFVFYSRWYHSGDKICGRFIASSSVPQGGSASPNLCFEIAETDSKRAKGLMFRKPNEIAPQEGMIFIYPEEGERAFWMKNTFTALDIIFMDANRKVVGVVADATPLTTSPRKVGHASQFIVELHAGSAKKWGIDSGATLMLDGVLPRAQ